jgi:hypothetical protein
LLKHTNKNNDSFLSLPFLQWQEIKPKPGASWPSARSAFQFASLLDEVFSHAVYLLQSALIARVVNFSLVALFFSSFLLCFFLSGCLYKSHWSLS